MRKKALRIVAGALTAALALGAVAGCSTQGAPEPEDYQPLSVAYLNKAGYEDIIVGDHEGLFADAGPEITLNPVTGSGQQSVEALLSGAADIAATGQGPVGDAIKEHGDDIVVLAGSNCSTGGQVWVAGPNMVGEAAVIPYDKATDNKQEVKASFESAAAVLGGTVRVGVQKGATTESEFKSWLKKLDISFNDFGTVGDGTVALVDVKANVLSTTLASGTDIDMMAASQPYPDTALAQVEGAYKVGSNADIDSYGVACLVTTKAVFDEKADSIKAFLMADQKACEFMNAHPEEAVQICADSEGSSVESVQAAFDIADFKVQLSDQMIETILQTCEKKGAGITEGQLKAQMPLLDWLKDMK